MTTPPKANLRALARKTLEKIPAEDRKLRDARLLQNLADCIKSDYSGFTRIATFAAMPHETDLSLLHPLLPDCQFHYPLTLNKQEMQFHLVSDPNTLATGRYGIPEPNPQKHPPVNAADLDLILVPGLAFDLQGQRLGHGAGFYDRFLTSIPLTPRIGVSLASQHLPNLPAEPHDQIMNLLVSDHGKTICHSV